MVNSLSLTARSQARSLVLPSSGAGRFSFPGRERMVAAGQATTGLPFAGSAYRCPSSSPRIWSSTSTPSNPTSLDAPGS